jgi:hypothetical protein
MNGCPQKVYIQNIKPSERNWNFALEIASQNSCCQINSSNGLKHLQTFYFVMEIVHILLLYTAYTIIAGAGKSFMRCNSTSNLTNGSFLAIRYLEKSLRLHQPRRIAYFYFDYSVKKQSAVDVLASLLNQLASPLETVPVCLKGLYGSFKSEDPRPDQAKLLELLVEFVEAYPEVFIFLDAFDECDPILRGHVVSIIKRLHEVKTKVWVTTQPGRLQDLAKDGLKDAIKAEIKAKEMDVASYVRAKLPTDGINDSLKLDIVNTISSGVDGMYDTCIALTDGQIFTCKSATGYGPPRRVFSTHGAAIGAFTQEPIRVLYERARAYSSCRRALKEGSATYSGMDIPRKKETGNWRTP